MFTKHRQSIKTFRQEPGRQEPGPALCCCQKVTFPRVTPPGLCACPLPQAPRTRPARLQRGPPPTTNGPRADAPHPSAVTAGSRGLSLAPPPSRGSRGRQRAAHLRPLCSLAAGDRLPEHLLPFRFRRRLDLSLYATEAPAGHRVCLTRLCRAHGRSQPAGDPCRINWTLSVTTVQSARKRGRSLLRTQR